MNFNFEINIAFFAHIGVMFRLVKFLCHEHPGAFEGKVSRDRSHKALLGCLKYSE